MRAEILQRNSARRSLQVVYFRKGPMHGGSECAARAGDDLTCAVTHKRDSRDSERLSPNSVLSIAYHSQNYRLMCASAMGDIRCGCGGDISFRWKALH